MPDPYNGFAGIAQYNRDLIDALCDLPSVDAVLSLARHAAPADPIPAKLREIHLPGWASRFVLRAILEGIRFHPDLIICGHVNLLPLACLLKRALKRPLILEAYGIEIWEKPRRIGSAIKDADAIVAISRFTRSQVLKWADIPPEKVRVIANAIHLESYKHGEKPVHLIERYGLQDRRVLLTLGRIEPERYKGHDQIIDLLPILIRDVPDLKLLIVGDGQDRARLEGRVMEMGLSDRVVFAGRIPEHEKLDHYNVADAFVMASTKEGFGFVFLEAAACGLPVLGGSIDGSRDALLDGKLGILVDPRNQDELVAGLRRLLAQEKSVSPELVRFDFPRFRLQIDELIQSFAS